MNPVLGEPLLWQLAKPVPKLKAHYPPIVITAMQKCLSHYCNVKKLLHQCELYIYDIYKNL